MKATKEIVETRVVEALSATPHKAFTVDKNLEPYALYNALVGTTFDAESYAILAESEEGVQYLYDHIPGGVKFVKEGETVEEPVVEPTPEPTPAPKVTPEEVEEHKGEEVTEENEKFDVDKDGDIDDDDVAKASEIEIES
jgi:hypothetical protein